MPNKQQFYVYPNGRKEMAFAVIDKSLKEYAPERYRNKLKSMVYDQIGSMKHPEFIASTVCSLINYELQHCYKEMRIPYTVLTELKRNLENSLNGVGIDGLCEQEKEEEK